MGKKYNKTCAALNCIEHFSFKNYWKSQKITAGIIRYKSIIKKKKKRRDEIVLLAKPKLNSIEVLTLS